jgi:hypothetical protein
MFSYHIVWHINNSWNSFYPISIQLHELHQHPLGNWQGLGRIAPLGMEDRNPRNFAAAFNRNEPRIACCPIGLQWIGTRTRGFPDRTAATILYAGLGYIGDTSSNIPLCCRLCNSSRCDSRDGDSCAARSSDVRPIHIPVCFIDESLVPAHQVPVRATAINAGARTRAPYLSRVSPTTCAPPSTSPRPPSCSRHACRDSRRCTHK